MNPVSSRFVVRTEVHASDCSKEQEVVLTLAGLVESVAAASLDGLDELS